MFSQILTIIVPIFFVLLLGYAAGLAKKFDTDQVAGMNELVLDFALPATLFVGTVGTSRDRLLQQAPLAVAMLIAILGLFIVVLLLGKHLFRHTLAVAALQALTVSFAAGPYFGPAVLGPIYEASSAVAISINAIILNIVIVPITLVLLGMSEGTARSGAKSATGSGAKSSIASLVAPALVNAIKTPFVWAPLLAVALVLVGVRVPAPIDSGLKLIGQATSGVALFVSGITIAASKIILNLEVGVNAVLKMVVQPAGFFLLALALRVKSPFIDEGLLLTALPTGPMAILLATRYNSYTSEASSALALTAMLMLIALPVVLFLIKGA